jgi:uncharacterized protein YndB with AHSA1/START domain
MMTDHNKPDAQRELKLELTLNAPRDQIWRCWTEPELLKQWFCPRPWKTVIAEIDLRPGGANRFLMQGPDGEESDNHGVYLEVVPKRRLVFTDAYTGAWRPSDKPFFTGIVEMEDAGKGKTRYTATARHWTEEACRQHEEMGFHEGWKQAALQLEELATRLAKEAA